MHTNHYQFLMVMHGEMLVGMMNGNPKTHIVNLNLRHIIWLY